jgi:NADPH:quinone reductase-like Zn-dependent oxidoreductase
MRTQSGFSVKNMAVFGADLAGTVDALGDGVSGSRVGDRSMAELGDGACAEHAVTGADAAVKIADSVSFDAAAACAELERGHVAGKLVVTVA